MKKRTKTIMLIILVVLIIFTVRWIININRAMVAAPDAFFFSVEGAHNDYEVLYLESAIRYDDETFPSSKKWDRDAYHLFVDSKYIENEWNYVYITGNYWYSPIKPTVTVNNQEITSVKADIQSGSMKNYHFYLYEIEEDVQYTITVCCGEDRERIKVVFHSE